MLQRKARQPGFTRSGTAHDASRNKKDVPHWRASLITERRTERQSLEQGGTHGPQLLYTTENILRSHNRRHRASTQNQSCVEIHAWETAAASSQGQEQGVKRLRSFSPPRSVQVHSSTGHDYARRIKLYIGAARHARYYPPAVHFHRYVRHL